MTLRQKWYHYLDIMGDETKIDESNALIVEIEKAMPFKNEKEHMEWLSMGETWMGDEKWLKMTLKIIKRQETVIYHVGLKKNSPYMYRDENWSALKDYWTTIKVGEGASESYIKYLAKANLMVQLAIHLLNGKRGWQDFYIDKSDMVVERA